VWPAQSREGVISEMVGSTGVLERDNQTHADSNNACEETRGTSAPLLT